MGPAKKTLGIWRNETLQRGVQLDSIVPIGHWFHTDDGTPYVWVPARDRNG
jgi:hypothetical protein